MSVAGVFLTAWDEVVTHRGRAALSAIGIVVGVFAFCVVTAAAGSAKATLDRRAAQLSGRAVTYELGVTRADTGDPVPFSPELRKLLDTHAASDGAMALSPDAVIDGISVVLTRTGVFGSLGPDAATVHGVGPSLADIRVLPVRAGRWLRDTDANLRAPAIVVNTYAAKSLTELAGAEPTGVVGEPVRLRRLGDPSAGRLDGRVVGVIDDGTTDHANIYVPFDAAVALNVGGGPNGPAVSAPPSAQAGGAAAALPATAPDPLFARWLVRARPAVRGDVVRSLQRDVAQATNGKVVLDASRTDRADDARALVDIVQAVLTAVALVVLGVAALGILNVGLVSVRQRTHEFGIRRAFGATRRDVFWAVVLESVLMTAFAGTVGAALAGLGAVGAPKAVMWVTGERPAGGFPLGALLLGLAVALAVGLVAGLVPARAATRGDVVGAIRRSA